MAYNNSAALTATMRRIFLFLSAILVAVSVQLASPLLVDTAVISELPAANGQRACPSSAALESAKTNLSNAIQQRLTSYLAQYPEDTPCGRAGWTPVVTLDLSDSSQRCPSAASPARSCYSSSSYNCRFPVSGVTSYTRVCGRATGYAVRTPDAFHPASGASIDTVYLDGISVTHGSPRQHIWSFAAGRGGQCPCGGGPSPPSYVGQNYFCDGAHNGALWDGMGCTAPAACCTFNSPPWFNVTLPTSTSDNIEVRICVNQQVQDEAVHLCLIELYVK